MFKRLIVSGCSQTYGHGLADISDRYGSPNIKLGPSRLAWPTYLGSLLECQKVSNLSMPASSNKRIAHVLSTFNKPITNNDVIIFCWTYLLRHAIIKDDNSYTYLHAHKLNKKADGFKESEAWLKYRIECDPDNYDLLHENLVWISWANQYAKLKTPHVYNFSMMGGIPLELQKLYNVNILQDLRNISTQYPLALDNSHPGPEAHIKFAEIIKTYIKKETIND